MKKLLILLLLLVTSVTWGSDWVNPYDPAAARKNLSNVTPATGRAALGLGTISTVNSPVPVANGGTGKTTAAEALAALGGASLNGSSTVAFNASTINGVAPLTAAEKTQALVGSNVSASNSTVLTIRTSYVIASFTEDLDTSNAFANSVFTAPATGVYLITFSVQWDCALRAAGDKVIARLLINGSAAGGVLNAVEKIATETTKVIAGSTIVRLTAGQTLAVGLVGTTTTVSTDVALYNWLKITKVIGE